MPQLLISFCNLVEAGHCLGVVDVDDASFRWLELPDEVIFKGDATGLCRGDGEYLVLMRTPNSVYLVSFDLDLRLKSVFPISMARDPHSMIYRDGQIYVVASGADLVVRLSKKPSGFVEEPFWHFNEEYSDTMHLNALVFYHGHLLVSMFGPAAPKGWLQSRHGLILDTTTSETVQTDLYHPHSLMHYSDSLFFLESRLGTLWEIGPDHVPEARYVLPGFARGLVLDEETFYIGVSGTRTQSRSRTGINLPASDPALAESYVCVVNRQDGSLQKIRMTHHGIEIYDLLLLEGGNLPDAKGG